MKQILYIIGVSGSGKTTIGRLLSQKTGLPFFDADDFHPTQNIDKMKAGIPLTDTDRKDWLAAIHQTALAQAATNGAIIACSALKENYRRQLSQGLQEVKWFFLNGSYEVIRNRMEQRPDHYMPPALLQSQFDTLEIPANALELNIAGSPDEICTAILNSIHQPSSFGIIGLGVMGKSLARNFASKGIRLSLFNRLVKGKEEHIAQQFITAHPELATAKGFEDLPAFVESLAQPACILVMVNAGAATDEVMNGLLPLLSPGSVIIDGGNAYFKDTERRIQLAKQNNIHWIGAGISGGEEGALNGPSIMPGGEAEAYSRVQPFLEMIAAKDENGRPCCNYTGSGGSGHFVKMIHNGIEYAGMQLIAEVYYILRKGLQKDPGEIAAIFAEWNSSILSSYLLSITIDILRVKENDQWLLDTIDAKAESKGTGSLATQTAAELGSPAGMMTSALFARFLSAQTGLRQQAAAIHPAYSSPLSVSVEQIRQSYELASIINHHQGFEVIKAAAKEYNWKIDLAALAATWTNGCIIRSALMNRLMEILQETDTMLFNEEIISLVNANQPGLRNTVAAALTGGLAVPALSEALNYILALTEADPPMNLIQAQRDYFGAHTYRLKNDPEGSPIHTDWKKFRSHN